MDCFPVEKRLDRYTLVVPLNAVYLYLGVCIPSPRAMGDSLIAFSRSLHINLPGPNDSSDTIIRRKLRWCLAAAVAPEYVVFWAARDCATAWWHSMDMQIRGHDYWTLTHSFVALMGGIVSENSDGRILLGEIAKIDKAQLSRIILLMIRDKSKSSNIVKTIACFQVGWLIVQCVGRRIQNLPITLLELATMAHAANCLLIYGLWWKKPLDISVPFEIAAGEAGVSQTKTGAFYSHEHPPEVYTEVTEHVRKTKLGALKARVLQLEVLRFGAHIALAAASTTLFGVIHLAGWDGDFASPAEKILWRVCASLVT